MTKAKAGAARYDWKTKAGRAALDEGVKGALGKLPALRGTIAVVLKMDTGDALAMRALSASLRRGVRDGWAARTGERRQTRHSRAVAK